MEMLRVVKEEAEKPEKEAKDQHQKLWEGMSRGGHYLSLAPGPVRSGDFLLIVICFLSRIWITMLNFSCAWLSWIVCLSLYLMSFVGIICSLGEERRGFSFCQPYGNTSIWRSLNPNSGQRFLQPLRQCELRSECRLGDFRSSHSLLEGIALWVTV